MRKKFILFSLLAMMGIVLLAAASVTVYALSFSADQAVNPSEQVKLAPVQAAPAEIQQVRYKSHSFGAGGCSHEAKMQMVQKAEEPKETSTEQLLTQAR